MIQQEIKFFWPLTEQLELDLDYSKCSEPHVHYDGEPVLNLYPIKDMVWITNVKV